MVSSAVKPTRLGTPNAHLIKTKQNGIKTRKSISQLNDYKSLESEIQTSKHKMFYHEDLRVIKNIK